MATNAPHERRVRANFPYALELHGNATGALSGNPDEVEFPSLSVIYGGALSPVQTASYPETRNTGNHSVLDDPTLHFTPNRLEPNQEQTHYLDLKQHLIPNVFAPPPPPLCIALR